MSQPKNMLNEITITDVISYLVNLRESYLYKAEEISRHIRILKEDCEYIPDNPPRVKPKLTQIQIDYNRKNYNGKYKFVLEDLNWPIKAKSQLEVLKIKNVCRRFGIEVSQSIQPDKTYLVIKR